MPSSSCAVTRRRKVDNSSHVVEEVFIFEGGLRTARIGAEHICTMSKSESMIRRYLSKKIFHMFSTNPSKDCANQAGQSYGPSGPCYTGTIYEDCFGYT